jgi:formate hydrogenlyase subunit 3/multisubunit Na+/H+ antiporter MnhD subunit
LGTFSTFYFAKELYKKEYFLNGTNLWVFWLMILGFLACTALIFGSKRSEHPKGFIRHLPWIFPGVQAFTLTVLWHYYSGVNLWVFFELSLAFLLVAHLLLRTQVERRPRWLRWVMRHLYWILPLSQAVIFTFIGIFYKSIHPPGFHGFPPPYFPGMVTIYALLVGAVYILCVEHPNLPIKSENSPKN